MPKSSTKAGSSINGISKRPTANTTARFPKANSTTGFPRATSGSTTISCKLVQTSGTKQSCCILNCGRLSTTTVYRPPLNSLPRRFACPRCQSHEAPLVRRRISAAGWLILVLLVFCLPLNLLGLLFTEEYRVCPPLWNFDWLATTRTFIRATRLGAQQNHVPSASRVRFTRLLSACPVPCSLKTLDAKKRSRQLGET